MIIGLLLNIFFLFCFPNLSLFVVLLTSL
uniref:Uncharacterized protein n=1 Tax=Rhizophora mucronata TaxID=61149 RepID=A0A2P2Q9V7_RHIMU